MNVFPELAVLPVVTDSPVIEAGLPNLADEAKFLLGAEGKSALDQLHGFFYRVGWSKDQMNVVRHDDKIMEQILSLISIAEENIQEQTGHPVGLEHRHFLIAGGGDEVTAQAGISSIWNGHNLTSAAEAALHLGSLMQA